MHVNSKSSDKIGIFLSFLCTIHCLALPIISIFFPVLKTMDIFDDHSFHFIMFFLILIPACWSFIPHAIKSKDLKVLILPSIAILILGFGNFFMHDHGSSKEIAINVFGSALLIFAHYRHFKSKTCCH